MAPSFSLRGLMAVICSLAVLSLAQGLDTVYVKPTSDTPCDKDPCLTLMEYVDNSSQYFTRDTEAVFLSGQHLLGLSITVKAKNSFTMRKEINAFQSHPEIVCTAAVSLSFYNVSSVSIIGLSFVSCGATGWLSTLHASNIGLFVLTNATVKQARAPAVYIVGSTFHSYGNHFLDLFGVFGGAISAHNSTMSIENNHFYNNSAVLSGGAVILNYCETAFSGVNTFVDNRGGHSGGGIILHASNVSFEGSSIFIHNFATVTGGAISSMTSLVSFTGNTTFMNNSVNSSPSTAAAALSLLYHDSVSFTGNTTFIRNGPSPATLSFQNNCTAVIEGGFTFEYNQGGLLARTSNITIKGRANFIHNSATLIQGSIIIIYHSRMAFLGTTLFAGNSPVETIENGFGAVCAIMNALIFMGNATFTNNRGIIGAAVINSTFHSFGNRFLDNTGIVSGSAIYASHSNITIENNQFYNNSASVGGGAVALDYCETVFSGVNTFVDNKAEYGGGIILHASNVSFEGSSIFIHNFATVNGGAISSTVSVVNFTGNTTFMSNLVSSSLRTATAALFLDHNSVSFTGNTTFIRNGPSPVTLFFQNNCTAVIEGIFTFNYNQGGLLARTSNITIKGRANFIHNSATNQGSALSVIKHSRMTFLGTTLFAGNSPVETIENGFGAVFVFASTILFMGNTIFSGNRGRFGAAIIGTTKASIEFNGTQTFEYNAVSEVGGAIVTIDSVVTIKGYSSFISNSADGIGGAIANVAKGELYITGNVTFISNQAHFGGGLYFEDASQIFLISPLKLLFQHNSAKKGGAIFVNDATNLNFCLMSLSSYVNCFIHVESLSSDIHLDFDGNTASDRGENVFGGMLDKCNVNENLFSPEQGLPMLINISMISSEPLRLCFCMNDKEDCTYDPPPFSVVRGATISVSAVALDQVNHTVAAIIRSYFPYKSKTISGISSGQGVQQIGPTCTALNYTILTTALHVTITLYPEGPCRDIGISQRQISVYLLPCPIAFELSDAQCMCEVRLQPFTNSCNTESQTFTRNTNFWVGTEYRDGNYTGLILHPHCPLDYCISNPADISVNNLDSQCNFNRSGILCGSCQQSLSLALGSSQCLPCSNYYLALFIIFAVAGVALVFVLFMLRLTLSTGTLSGLVFYANIMSVNKEIFFPPRTINVLTVFIAWLNLDLGIETCFFNGMDTYARTWLQYVFPFYIWLLVSIIIVTSHYSVRVPKLLGRNPIAVLATLFLLSYAKLLRTIIASFSATVLEYPGNSTDTVWLYDGSIRYLRGKHVPLFLFSLVILLFLFLPYTVLLFFSQWLQVLSNKKFLFWMNNLRMKTFLDAYHAPYNIKHRYWTGLLLLLRCVLFLVFASNASGDPSVNLLAITSVALGLAVSTRVIGQVYSKWWLDVLEGSFILNLGIIAAATYHVMQSGGNQSAVAYLSVSVTFIEFTGIITYHMYLQLKDTTLWSSAQQKAQKYIKCRKTEENEEPPNPLGEIVPKPPSTTFIDLREPLLDSSN